jgi:hypothetical protein
MQKNSRRLAILCVTISMLSLAVACGGSKSASSVQVADNSGLYQIVQGGKSGYIDATGKLVINPQFDNAGDFHEGFADVVVKDRSGYIDKTGKLVVPPQFDDNSRFSEGLAAIGSTPVNRGQAASGSLRNQCGGRPRRLTRGKGTGKVSNSWTVHR